MKKLILISALLFSFNSWADLKPLSEYPIEDIDYDTELAIEIGTRCLAVFGWGGTYESKQYSEKWLEFLYPLLIEDPTHAAVEFQKLKLSVEPIVRDIREYSNSNEGYQKILNEMDICIELIVDEPFIDDSDFTLEDKADAIAHTFYVKNTGMFDFLTLQMGRTLHEQLRGISFAEANRLIRSGELAYAYGELQDLMIDTIGGAGNLLIEEAKEFKDVILAELSDKEIDNIYNLLPKGDLKTMNDLAKLDPINNQYPNFSELNLDFLMSVQERRQTLFASDEFNSYLEDGFDKILTKYGYPLVISIDTEADISGLWTHMDDRGEIIEIVKEDKGYVATKKVSKDEYVPEGEKTFSFDLDFESCEIQFAQENFQNPFLVDCKVFEIGKDKIILSGPAGLGGFQLKRNYKEQAYPMGELINKEADILGKWVGFYEGFGEEIINISKINNRYVARKITGDQYVPTGEITFQFDTNLDNCKIQFANIGFKNPYFKECEIFRLNSSNISLGDNFGMLHFNRSAPRNGPYEKFNRNGQFERSHYKGGKLEGSEERFFVTGELYWRRNFKNGELHGAWESFYIDGKTSALSNWRKGKEIGHTKFSYHNNGQLKNRVNFKNGKMEGLGEVFFDNGNLEQRSNFKTGKKEGLYERFYKNGELMIRGKNKDDQQDGLWEYFDEEGNLIKTEKF